MALKYHIAVIHEKINRTKNKCEICGYQTYKPIRVHMRKVHEGVKSKMHKCDYCTYEHERPDRIRYNLFQIRSQ